jgi:AcrR family transcriptional regulator
MTTHTPPSASPLSARQEARRARILGASAELARQGGYEAVQMRAVAERSGVALGTLYRYFPSKVHLLVAVMHDQLGELHATLHHDPPAHQAPAARVTATLLRAFRALQHEPDLAEAMMRALSFADSSVSREVREVSRLTAQIVLDASGIAAPEPDQLSAVRVITHTWHSVLIAWLAGRASIPQVEQDIRTASRLLG